MGDPVPEVLQSGNVQPLPPPKEPSLQWLAYGIGQQTIAYNIERQRKELLELRKEQEKVRDLQRLHQHVAAIGTDETPLILTDEIKDFIDKARKYGAIIPDYKDNQLTRDQRIDLQDRIRSTSESLNQDNDMRLQSVSRITNVLHEMYALMRTIMRTGHEIYKTFARKMDARG